MKYRSAAICGVLVLLAFSLLLVAAAQPARLASSSSAAPQGDPCDSSNNCIAPSVSYVRANPDNTLYVGDQFVVNLNEAPTYSSGSCGNGCTSTTSGSFTGAAWSYDTTVFTMTAQSQTAPEFTVTGNHTGTYTIGVTASFETTSCTNINGTISCSSPVQSSVGASAQVTIIQLVLSPEASSKIINVTNALGLPTRNPDGTFYRGDEFCIQWQAHFQFDTQRTDIKVNVTAASDNSLKAINFTGSNHGGQTCFAVSSAADYKPYNLSLDFHAINWMGESIAHATVSNIVSYAVVKYSPVFAYYTYTDYNETAPSLYQRHFATLVRYDGNMPGYTSSGGETWSAFLATNSTDERALVTDFMFTTAGWNTSMPPTGILPLTMTSVGNIPFIYTSSSPVTNPLSTQLYSCGSMQNSTTDTHISPHLFTWANRYQKWYFQAPAYQAQGQPNAPYFLKYTVNGTEYFGVAETATACNFAGGNSADFKTSYLYQPLFLNGMLNFVAVGQDGQPDPTVQVNVTAINPSPLNVQILKQEQQIFGNDKNATTSLEHDLYNAYNSTIPLKPVSSNNGVWSFMINQTNLASFGDPYMPDLYVTTVGHGNTAHYTILLTFSLFELQTDAGVFNSSLPAPLLIEYVDAGSGTFAMPIQYFNFTAGAQTEYVLYGPLQHSDFLGPDVEPGMQSVEYPYLFGQNQTVTVNTMGGGVYLSGIKTQNSPSLSLYIAQSSGGVSAVWLDSYDTTLCTTHVVTVEGTALCQVYELPFGSKTSGSQILPPYYPSGFWGNYSVPLDLVPGEHYAIVYNNVWNASSIITTFATASVPSNPPAIPMSFEIFLGMAFIALFFVSRVLIKRRAKR